MTEPRRLIETEQGRLARALLAHGEQERPSSQARKRVTSAAIGALGAGATLGAAATASGAQVAWTSLVGWGCAGVAVALAMVVPLSLRRPAQAPAVIEAPGSAEVRSAPLPSSALVEAQPATIPSSEVPRPLPSVRVARSEPSGSSPTPSVSPSPVASTDQLAAEVAQIDRARNALAAGDAQEALRALDARDRLPQGALGPEAQVLRIEALLKQGKREDAARAAEAFLRAYPTSPLVPRVQSLLAACRSR